MDEPAPDQAASPRASRREAAIAALLVVCVVLVGFWEIMSHRSQRAFAPFKLTGESFVEFSPTAPGWSVERLPVNPDPVEPNIIAMLVRPRGGNSSGAPVLVRLVHGYNMVDCMRIKGETVASLLDTRADAAPPIAAARALAQALPHLRGADGATRRVQLWRLESSAARVSLWATSMLRAGDFSETDVDTRAMPFPRVDVPDNPGWFPQGLTWRSLRHPIANGRLFLRAKWNASRADLLTFLGLRQPAWASDELLTLVATTTETTVEPEREAAVADAVLGAHGFIHGELQGWAGEQPERK